MTREVAVSQWGAITNTKPKGEWGGTVYQNAESLWRGPLDRNCMFWEKDLIYPQKLTRERFWVKEVPVSFFSLSLNSFMYLLWLDPNRSKREVMILVRFIENSFYGKKQMWKSRKRV